MQSLPPLMLLIAASTGLHAQSVQVALTALTPITVQAAVSGQTASSSVPIGPLAPGLVSASLPVHGFVSSLTEWNVFEAPSTTSATIISTLHASAGIPASVQAGPHEFLMEFSAAASLPGKLRITHVTSVAPLAPTPLVDIDVWNDGTIDFVSLPSGGVWEVGGLLFGTQPVPMRVIMSSTLQGTGYSTTVLGITAMPDNNLITATAAIGCSYTGPLIHQAVFADYGIDVYFGWLADPVVLVIGLSQQPVLLPSFLGTACLLLPSTDILLWNGASDYHVPLPAAVRPATFFAQGVAVTPSGLLPTDAIRVDAF